MPSTLILRAPPLGLPPVPVPAANPPTAEKIALGRKLFFDRRLSENNTMSCAMCHVPEQGFTNNELATPIGVAGRSLRRNAPTILSAAYQVTMFHDGRERSLEGQALAPLVARDELANPSLEFVVAKVSALAEYAGLFERAFGGPPTVARIGQAIAGWERTLLAGNSPFDRWRYGGQADALTGQQKLGFELFAGKAGCAACHPLETDHALFADHAFHDTGTGYRAERERARFVHVELAPGVYAKLAREVVQSVGEPRQPDQGRYEVTSDPADRWRFKTPSLRNVARTAPYMHDGSLAALVDVVQFYDRGGEPHPGLDPLMRPLGLNSAGRAALVAFLESLTATNLDALVQDARSVPVGNQ